MNTATHGVCPETEKTIYYSKRAARRHLRGHLASKAMRPYRCDYHPGHYHLTREWKRGKNASLA